MPRTPATNLGISSSPPKEPENGYFTKGQWHCNCKPRLPAVQFQVRRESANKGRWFWTCQIPRTKGKTGNPANCGFFLWDDEAKQREKGAVLNNSRTEPSPRKKLVQTTLSASVKPRPEGPRHWTERTDVTPLAELERQVRGERSAPPVPVAAPAMQLDHGASAASSKTLDHDYAADLLSDMDEDLEEMVLATSSKPNNLRSTSAGSKRKQSEVEEEEEDYGLDDISSDEERLLVDITDSSTPPVGAKKRDAFATPATERRTNVDVAGGMPTPLLTDKSVRRVLFTEPEVSPSAKRQKIEDPGTSFSSEHSAVGGATPSRTTPTSSQEGPDAQTTPATLSAASSLPNITAEVLSILRSQKLDDTVLRQVSGALERYAAKAKGLERGRDASRLAVRKAEAKVAQLQERIADLENRRKLDAEARLKLRRGLIDLYTEN
ncbi:hypothetical protein BX600DRAFT_508440 [Xylariales sp. PMI_506]|nr:hypothetical protein BX600DRAFT_508440 [Xylariales sp. PMI_506]